MRKSDKIVISKIRIGDKAIFRELFEEYFSRLYQYAYSYVDDQAIAEDIVQDLFFHLWERHKEISIYSSVSSYLFRAVHNRSIQHLRHKKIENQFEERQKLKLLEAEVLYQTADFSLSGINVNEINRIISAVLESLPEKARTIYALSREENKTNKDIAEHLNVSVKTVEYHVSGFLRSFRIALRDYIVVFIAAANIFLV